MVWPTALTVHPGVASPDEVRVIAAALDTLRVHHLDTSVDGRLTPERVHGSIGAETYIG